MAYHLINAGTMATHPALHNAKSMGLLNRL
jgi:hypothetical protein